MILKYVKYQLIFLPYYYPPKTHQKLGGVVTQINFAPVVLFAVI